MTAFQLDNGLSGFLVTGVAPLAGGGFAVLLRTEDPNSNTEKVVVVFERASDGSVRQVGAPIDIQEGSLFDFDQIVPLANGGFAVPIFFDDVSLPNGRKTVINFFKADGTPDGVETSLAILGYDNELDTTRDPLKPELWVTVQDGGVIGKAPADSNTMLPAGAVLPTLSGFYFFDGGFGLLRGVLRGEFKSAIDLVGEVGPVPSFLDPGIFSPPGSVGGIAPTTAGNNIIETYLTSRTEVVNGGSSISHQKVNLVIYQPDSQQPIEIETEEFRQTLLQVRLVEVPGIGFAVLMLGQNDGSMATTLAEVRVFDFNGNFLGSASLDDVTGAAPIGLFEFTALADPSNAALRFFVTFSEIAPISNPMGKLVVIDPVQGPLGSGQVIAGTAYGDYLAGLDSDDSLQGRDGNDVIDGYAGTDILTGQLGDDMVRGGIGADILFGDEGNDSVLGGAGDDVMVGGLGEDDLHGGAGKDTIDGNEDNDLIEGEGGNDLLTGGSGNDSLDGGVGADTVSGGDGDDSIEGGTGNDTMTGGLGSDTIFGGNGTDRIFAVEDLSGTETVGNRLDGGDGNDFIVGSAGSDFISGGLGDDFLSGNLGDDRGGRDHISGGDGNDDLAGGRGADELSGGRGQDFLSGSFGNDTLLGGRGQDKMIGGGGADIFLFTSIADTGIGRARDVIKDFAVEVDVIDLDLIFIGKGFFVGSDPFSGTRPEIRYERTDGIVQGDVNGDGAVDFEIKLVGVPDLLSESFLV